MRKLAILHFNPIELYPPVLNWLDFLQQKEGQGFKVRIFSIGRLSRNKFYAYLKYLGYYSSSTFQLIWWRPDIIMYYETLSCLPALFYKKYINRNVRLFIHYHEYTSLAEYAAAGWLTRWARRKELKLLSRAEWISHTNADRIELFREDLKGINLPAINVLPNYPPASWHRESRGRRDTTAQVKLVYVGALSLDTMFVKEFAEWVIAQSGKVIWDIYSGNATDEVKNYLGSVGKGLIRFRDAIKYSSLPQVLAGYDVGVILYRGHIPNYVYNAPNKLFEYMACGLDTWLPDLMKSSLPFVTKETYPKVLAVDFFNLAQFNLSSSLDRKGLNYSPSPFYSEKVLFLLLDKMKQIESQ
jgi:hypothetical protein